MAYCVEKDLTYRLLLCTEGALLLSFFVTLVLCEQWRYEATYRHKCRERSILLHEPYKILE